MPSGCLPWLRQARRDPHSTSVRPRAHNATFHLGGHSSEALSLVSALDFSRYTPRTYIVSEGDLLSEQKAIALERLKSANVAASASSLASTPRPAARFFFFALTIPNFSGRLRIAHARQIQT